MSTRPAISSRSTGSPPVLGGVVAEDAATAKAAAEQLGTPVVVVKAQVKTGGEARPAV